MAPPQPGQDRYAAALERSWGCALWLWLVGGCLGLLGVGEVLGGSLEFEGVRQSRRVEVGVGEVGYEYRFRNGTGEHVALAGIEEGCGCLRGKAEFESVAPGECGVVRATLQTANLFGTVVKSLWVTFSNGERHELVAELTIVPTLVVEPGTLEWPCGAPAGERAVDVRVVSGPPLELLDVVASTEEVEVRREVVEAGRHYVVYLRPKSTAAEMSAVVQVRTSSHDSRDAIRAVFVAVAGDKVAGGNP